MSQASTTAAFTATATPAASPARTTRLIMVTAANNNKFYEMREAGDGTFTVEYGRVGSTPSTRRYPLSLWDQKYREKRRKGYQDVTHLYSAAVAAETEWKINDASVRRLVRALQRYSRSSIRANYTVSADQVTQQHVEEAQAILDELARQAWVGADIDAFNGLLIQLFMVIPRRMTNVKDHLVRALASPADVEATERMLAEEQATLDVMAGQVKLNARAQDATAPRPTLSEAMGLTIEPVTDAETEHAIREAMGEQAGLFRRAFRVTNHATQSAFDAFVAARRNARTALLWHGSRNENWLSILERGLALRPANAIITGKMFGYGLYFADQCRKSVGYTSLHGSFWTGGGHGTAFLALYDVHLGDALTVRVHKPWHCTLTAVALSKRSLLGRKKTYDSVFAQRGLSLRHNEYIVYHEAQCTVRYLVEIGA